MENNVEDKLIGCILFEPESLYEIYDKVKPEMFSSLFCKRVYETALSLFDQGKKFDPTILANELATPESSPEVFEKRFGDLILDCVSSVLISSYAEQMIKTYKDREVKQVLKDITTTPTTIDDDLGNLITKLEEIQGDEVRHDKTAKEIWESEKNNYFDGNKDDDRVIKIGLDKLDDTITLERGDITVIGARPSVGKSALALQIAKNVCEQGYKVGYFNLEMRESQIMERFIASLSGISLKRIRKAKSFLNNEKDLYYTAGEKFTKYNLVVSTGSKTDFQIKAKSRHQHFDLIIVDYLQLVRSSKRCENRRVEVGEVSRSFKGLASELDVPIIVLSQLTRSSEYTVDREPTMNELKESGDVEQDASIILLMWNIDKNDKRYKGLKVDKNRQDELMTEILEFKGEFMSFVETDKTIEEVKAELKDFEPVESDEESPFN